MKKLILLTALLLTVFSQLYSQQFTNFTVANTSKTLPDNSINVIAIDAQGNKWFGTPNGVSKFDGTTWTTYTTANGLANNNVTSIAIDAQGNKWFGTSVGGVSKFDGTTWTTYTTTNGLANNIVTSIAIDAEGNKWFGTYGGVSKFDGTTWNTYTTADGLANNKVYSIAIDAQGNKWFGTWGGVSKFDGATWINYTTADGLVGNQVKSIAIDAQGNKWFGALFGGVSKFDGTTWKSYTNTANGSGSNTVNSIAIDAQGNKWFCTRYAGVSKFDGTTWTYYSNTVNSSGDMGVNSIAIDAQGNKWFGNDRFGVSKFDGTTWTTYTTANGLAKNFVSSIGIDVQGNKWFASDGGVTRFDGTTWTTYTTANGLANNIVTSIAIDAQGNKWFGTWGGVSKFNGTTWNTYTNTNNWFGDNRISCIAIDAQGSTWVGTEGGGVSKFDGNTWSTYTTIDGLANDNVWSIAIDAKGDKWFGTGLFENGGVSRFDGTTWTNGLANIEVKSIAIDAHGNTWAGTLGGGVSKFDGTTWTTYTTIDGLANDRVWSIAIDAKGDKWFGTDGGVSKFDGTTWTTYNTANGLVGNWVYSIAIDAQGNIWFGTDGGVSRLNNLNSVPTDIALTANAINENVVANSAVGTLSTTDPDAGNTFTYSLVSGTGSTDNASFIIEGSNLKISNSPDFETKSSYSVRVRTTDQGSLYFEKEFTISINDVNEVPAMEITSTSGSSTPSICTSLKEAFDKINDGTHTGDITIKVFASTIETATAVLNANGAGNASYNLVKIYPTATGLSISGNLEAPLIDLNGATNVTINGSLNGADTGKDLTIINTNASATEGTSTIRFINDAAFNTIKYCTLKGSSLDWSAGILFFSKTTGTTGNSHNIIENNDITNALDANRPINAIYSYGTDLKQNSANEIRHNNIYDFLNRDNSSSGIEMEYNSTAWTITANSFYETTVLVPTRNRTFKFITNNKQGDNFTITDNFIGGNSSDHSGIFTVNSETEQDFVGIELELESEGTTTSIVQNNTIQNISYTTTSCESWAWLGISSRGNVDIIGNNIGASDGTGSITLNVTDAYQGEFFAAGIYANGGNVKNNTVGSINLSATDPNASPQFYGIASSGQLLKNNVIGSKTMANSINCISASHWIIYGILSGNADISDNTVANISNGTSETNTNSTGLINGIYSASPTVTNNTVHDLTTSNPNVNQDGMASVIGISQTSTAANQTITGNSIYNLSNSTPDFTGSVIGLYYIGGTGGTNVVTKNFIQSLSVSANSTGANIYGIKTDAGATTYANNIISLTGNTATTMYGIYENDQAGNTTNLYFNTVQLGGSLSAGATNKSYALFSSDKTTPMKAPAANAQKISSNFNQLFTNRLNALLPANKQQMNSPSVLQSVKSSVTTGITREFKNNIFSNSRSTVDGTNLHYAVGLDLIDNTTLALDYNDYLATGTGGALANISGTNQTTLPLVVDNDAHSISLNPKFKNSIGTDATDYFPLTAALAGVPVATVTTDFAGIIRNATIPSMGAVEYVESAPTVTTQEVSGIEHDGAIGNGNLTNLGVPYPTAYGVCWNTTGTPTTSDSKVDNGAATTTGAFIASMKNLTDGTKYYVRAYATNNVNTSYGEEASFTTVSTAGLNDAENLHISVYPNPTTDAFRIMGLNGVSFISLTDLSGRTLIQKQVSDNEAVSVSTLPTGVYILKIKNNEGTTERKVLKK